MRMCTDKESGGEPANPGRKRKFSIQCYLHFWLLDTNRYNVQTILLLLDHTCYKYTKDALVFELLSKKLLMHLLLQVSCHASNLVTTRCITIINTYSRSLIFIYLYYQYTDPKNNSKIVIQSYLWSSFASIRGNHTMYLKLSIVNVHKSEDYIGQTQIKKLWF